MTEEAFIRAVLDAPGQDTPRLVYADWLDDHDAPDRAAYLRAEAAWAAPWRTGVRPAEPTELQRAAAELDPLWVARVSRPPLGACCDRLRWKASGDPLELRHLDEIRRWHRVRLPADYAAFLLNHNGGHPLTAEFGWPELHGYYRGTRVRCFYPFQSGGDFREQGTLNGEVDRYWKVILPERLDATPWGGGPADVTWHNDFIPVADAGEQSAILLGVYGEHRGRLQFVHWPFAPSPFDPKDSDELGGSFAGLLAILSAPLTVSSDATQA